MGYICTFVTQSGLQYNVSAKAPIELENTVNVCQSNAQFQCMFYVSVMDYVMFFITKCLNQLCVHRTEGRMHFRNRGQSSNTSSKLSGNFKVHFKNVSNQSDVVDLNDIRRAGHQLKVVQRQSLIHDTTVEDCSIQVHDVRSRVGWVVILKKRIVRLAYSRET